VRGKQSRHISGRGAQDVHHLARIGDGNWTARDNQVL
jgi:hypothetical protein